jgi:predicted nucleotidyltransferase
MIHTTPLPEDIEERLCSLGQALQQCSSILFAYLFGGAATSRLRPLSDVDVAVYLDESVDAVEGRLEAIGVVTAHLRTDEVDLVVLNTAPTALTGRILQTRQVICDRDPLRRHRFESLALREFFDFRLFEHRLLVRRYGSPRDSSPEPVLSLSKGLS